ncbi:ankyrin repeat-containing domain protein [Flagelloscypha sp. PMI_526]|nr:ankyrin repeat-containing domain protein [Flagelloscypha sp. PMI_526]
MHIRTLRTVLRPAKLMSIAKSLPKSPDEYYRLTLDRIRAKAEKDPEACDAALASLFWVLHAKRPLRTVELPKAVASVLDDLTGCIVKRYLIPLPKLLELCESLLWVQGDTVTFSHLTIREFFNGVDDTVFTLSNSSSGSSKVPCLGKACLGFLNAVHAPQDIENWVHNVTHERQSDWGTDFRLYCADFWGDHLPSNASTDVLRQMETTASNSVIFSVIAKQKMIRSWGIPVRELHEGPNATPTTMAHLAAIFNIVTYWDSGTRDSINTPGFKGYSPLHCACLLGFTESVERLLSFGAHVNTRSGELSTPLHYAAQLGHASVVELLLSQANVEDDPRNAGGRSPFWIACSRGHVQVVKLLLSRPNVDVELRDTFGRSPLWAACWGGYEEAVQSELSFSEAKQSQAHFETSLLRKFSYPGQSEVLRLLLARDNDMINLKDRFGVSPLHVAYSLTKCFRKLTTSCCL